MRILGYQELEERIEKGKLILLDGGTGTEVYRRGVRGFRILPWAVNGLVYSPKVVLQIHQDYFESGANVVIANSFYTTEYALESSDDSASFAGTAETFTRFAVYLAREAMGLAKKNGKSHEMCVAGSVGPLEVGDPYDPRNTPGTLTIKRENEQRIRTITDAGADLLLVETMTTMKEALANTELIEKLQPRIPFWLGFSFTSGGTLWSGEGIKDVFKLVKDCKIKPKVLLINCTGIENTTNVLETIKQLGIEDMCPGIPIGIKANAEEIVYPGSTFFERPRSMTPIRYANYCKMWHDDFGIRILGGCCGTTPDDIVAIGDRLKKNT